MNQNLLGKKLPATAKRAWGKAVYINQAVSSRQARLHLVPAPPDLNRAPECHRRRRRRRWRGEGDGVGVGMLTVLPLPLQRQCWFWH